MIWNKRAGNERHSRDTERKEGLGEEEMLAHFLEVEGSS